MNVISTNKAPQAIGPYSQAIFKNGFLFASGQIAINPSTGNLVEGGIESQTDQVMKNIGEILSAANLTYSDVVKTTVFITDMGSFPLINAIYGEYFKSNPPARSCVAVSALPKGALIEVEIVASK